MSERNIENEDGVFDFIMTNTDCAVAFFPVNMRTGRYHVVMTPIREEPELKPCDCGASMPGIVRCVYPGLCEAWFVRCGSCERSTGERGSEADAIVAWNRRKEGA
jgi:hypothetical protein